MQHHWPKELRDCLGRTESVRGEHAFHIPSPIQTIGARVSFEFFLEAIQGRRERVDAANFWVIHHHGMTRNTTQPVDEPVGISDMGKHPNCDDQIERAIGKWGFKQITNGARHTFACDSAWSLEATLL